MPFQEGDRVRLKTPVVEGPISDITFDKAAGQVAYEVTYTDAEGHEQIRFFPEGQLELVAAAPVSGQEG